MTKLKYKCKCGSQSYEIVEVYHVCNKLFIYDGVLDSIGVSGVPEPTGIFYVNCKCGKTTKLKSLMYLDSFIEKYKDN